MGSKKRNNFEKLKQNKKPQFKHIDHVVAKEANTPTLADVNMLLYPTDLQKQLRLKSLYLFFVYIGHAPAGIARKFQSCFWKNLNAVTTIFKNTKATWNPALTRKLKKSVLRTTRLSAAFNYFLFVFLLSRQVKDELQFMFLISSNQQQYFLNSMGINLKFFKSYSSGRCLRSEFGPKTSKGLKKSLKLNKALIDFYYFGATPNPKTLKFSYVYLRPFNKRSLIMLTQMQQNSEYYPTDIGFHKYYKVNFKRACRIKKKIKKRLTSENLQANPYPGH